MKILPKILLPVLLCASIGLFISTVYTYEMSIDSYQESSISLQKMAITNALVELKAGLDFNILNAISLAQTGILQPYLSKNYQLKMAYRQDAIDRIVNMRNTYYYIMIGILDTDGIVLAHTEPSFTGRDFSSEPFFKQAMHGKVAVGAPYRYQDNVVYPVASPVYDVKNGEIIGVVFNVSKLTDTMSERMLLGDHGYLFVADETGIVFIHRDNSKVLGKKLIDFDWGREILSKGHGNIKFNVDGRNKIAYYDFLPEANWTAVAVRDLDEMETPGRELRNRATAIAIIIIMLLGLIIYYYVKHIVDALLKAVLYAEQISKGVLDKDLEFGENEIGLLERFWLKIGKVWACLFAKNKVECEEATSSGLEQFVRKDEIGVLYNSLQTMVDSMRTMVNKADDSNRMKSEFLANMSHEIRTPLNAVIGLAHLCLNSNDDEEKKRDYIKKIEIAGKSLLGIINNVLDTSKIEAGMLELEHLQFNLRDVGESVLTIYQDSAKVKNLDLKFIVDDDVPHYFMGDPVRLGQVMNNFVGNAIKFTEKGNVQVHCSMCKSPVGNVPEGSVAVNIAISDSGIGISKDQEHNLFKPFAQADTSITRRFGGTGLGLVISKHIVELMQGRIEVDSELGKGTTFNIIINFPLAEGDNIKPVEDARAQILNLDLSGKRILVVEDNMINQLIMDELLQKTNAEISIADNGQVAVDMVGQKTFDIILMDMQMPIMDGIQATGIIRQYYKIEDLPIIAVTANALKEDKEQGIAIGLNDYLTKPIDPVDLMMVLKLWLVDKQVH